MTQFTDSATESTTYRRSSNLLSALKDAYNGFMALTHNGLAVTGMMVAVLAIAFMARPDLRQQGEQQLLALLQDRQATQDAAEVAAGEASIPIEPDAAERATALVPSALPKQQAKVAFWLSRKYRVAPEPLGVLVSEAFEIGERVRIDPTLILAVMAIESRFNPFAQSPVGAQGLMQVLTRVHTDKYDNFGGRLAAFDPVTNLRVGAQVLRDCIKRAGSTEGGLRLYVGAVTTDGSGYINKVMAEHLRIQSVALGKPMPSSFPSYSPKPVGKPVESAPTAIEAMASPTPPVEAETTVAPKIRSESEIVALIRS